MSFPDYKPVDWLLRKQVEEMAETEGLSEDEKNGLLKKICRIEEGWIDLNERVETAWVPDESWSCLEADGTERCLARLQFYIDGGNEVRSFFFRRRDEDNHGVLGKIEHDECPVMIGDELWGYWEPKISDVEDRYSGIVKKIRTYIEEYIPREEWPYWMEKPYRPRPEPADDGSPFELDFTASASRKDKNGGDEDAITLEDL